MKVVPWFASESGHRRDGGWHFEYPYGLKEDDTVTCCLLDTKVTTVLGVILLHPLSRYNCQTMAAPEVEMSVVAIESGSMVRIGVRTSPRWWLAL